MGKGKYLVNLFTLILTLAVPVFAQSESSPVLEKVGTYQCGRQPKQVLFSPDGKFIIMPLLDDDGFDIFSVEEKKIVQRINPPNSEKKGFAEGLFIPEHNAFLVSQMTTAKVYEYSYPDFTYRRTLETEGTWSKFIAWCHEKQLVAVSNWVSNDISLIDWNTGKVVRSIKTGAAPRGMVFTNGGECLISLSFDDGIIEKFSTESGKQIAKLEIENAAMRHIAVDSEEKYAYVSDMYHRSIYKINISAFSIVKTVRVFNNPNTIQLLNDKWLFVSSRGPNNPTDYTKRSPVNGKISVIKTEDMSVELTIEGGNQPTGLAVSHNGQFLCFSNFQDATIELYKISFSLSQ